MANKLKPQFYRKVLKNGFTLILEKRELPLVSVAFAVRNGGINETEEEKGISHYIEHMLYKGTPKRNAKQIAIDIEKNGGELNGFTSEKLTAYWCKIPSNKLNIALDVLSDMVKNPLFDETELVKERKVIFEEMKMYHDTPRLHVFDELQKSLFESPFGIPLIGTNKSMNSIDRKKIIEKFKKIYQPNNMVLCVVGDADFNSLVNYVEKNFSNEKGIVPEIKIKIKNHSEIEKRKGIDQASLVYGYHIPTSEDDKCYAAQVLSAVTALGMSSRLFEEIREKRNLAYAVKGDSSISKEFAYNVVYVGTMKENIEQIKEIIIKEFKKVALELEEKELNQVKEQLIGNHKLSMEDSQSQMVTLLNYEVDGDIEDFYEYEKKISQVKLKDVKELAKKASEDYSFFALVPE